jgi:hypothetical protein
MAQEEVHRRQSRFRENRGPAAGEANEGQAEYGNARLRTSINGDRSFDRRWPWSAGWTDQQQQGLIRRFASSIGHNHGLFDET